MSETTELHLPETLHIEAEPPPAQEGERQLSPREKAMADIAKRAEERRGLEIAQGAVYDAEARERGEALPGAEADEPDEVAEAGRPLESTPAEPVTPKAAEHVPDRPLASPQLRTLVLNGQQIAVTEEQFTQLAQMGAIAGMQMSQAPVAPPQHQPVQEPPKPSVALDESKVRETVQRIQFGSPEEGTTALAGLIRDVVAQVPQAPDHNAIAQQAEQRALQAIAQHATTATVRAEYPEIFKDQGLMALAKQRSEQVYANALATGQRMSELDVYREAGNQVYDLLKLPRPGSQVQTPTAIQAAPAVQPRAGIEERKRAAPRNPQSVDRRSSAPEAPRAPTGSQIVDWMRKERGQAAFN